MKKIVMLSLTLTFMSEIALAGYMQCVSSSHPSVRIEIGQTESGLLYRCYNCTVDSDGQTGFADFRSFDPQLKFDNSGGEGFAELTEVSSKSIMYKPSSDSDVEFVYTLRPKEGKFWYTEDGVTQLSFDDLNCEISYGE